MPSGRPSAPIDQCQFIRSSFNTAMAGCMQESIPDYDVYSPYKNLSSVPQEYKAIYGTCLCTGLIYRSRKDQMEKCSSLKSDFSKSCEAANIQFDTDAGPLVDSALPSYSLRVSLALVIFHSIFTLFL
jgi:hypothetical protein